jgi:uncharacterized protein YuzE
VERRAANSESSRPSVAKGGFVKANYDARTDTLSLILKEDTVVAESDEDKPGVILDYDEYCNLVSVEILDASRRVTDAKKMDFQVAV